MSKNIEMNEFIALIKDKYGEEVGLDSAVRKIIYRATKEFGIYDSLVIRSSFEKLQSILMNEHKLTLTEFDKATLMEYRIRFGEGTNDNININAITPKYLLILDEWVNTIDFDEKVRYLMDEGTLPDFPTDLYIEHIENNEASIAISDALNNRKSGSITLWYTRSSINHFKVYNDKKNYVQSKYLSEEVIDITYDMLEYFDAQYLTAPVIKQLIKYGQKLYEDGFKCILCGEVNSVLEVANEDVYAQHVAIFLVYLAETYNFEIVTAYDNFFSNQYVEYASGSYLLAEDLFTLTSRYNRFMAFLTYDNHIQYLFVRDVDRSYTYHYFLEEEFNRILTGDTSVDMHSYKSPRYTQYDELSGVDKTPIDQIIEKDITSAYADNSEILCLYQYFENDTSRIADAVKAINNYLAKLEIRGMKILTARDILIRKEEQLGNEVIQIGFITTGNLTDMRDTYGNRMKETVIVSKVNPNNDKHMVSDSYFTLTQSQASRLFPLKYVYDIRTEAPTGLLKFVDATNSIDTEVINPAIDYDDDGNVVGVSYASTAGEKFLVYALSASCLANSRVELKEDLAKDIPEYIASMHRGVFTMYNVVPQFTSMFSVRNAIKAELVDCYGELSDKFIDTKDGKSKFLLKSELFGRMEMDS